jgi:DNA-binding MarR family transcriptional regulator
MATVRRQQRIQALTRAIARAGDADRRLRLAAAERFGVGATDFDVLVLLDTAGPLAAGRIAEAMAITTGAVTGLIDRLERAGYVQRTRHETDRRQVLIELAPARRDELDTHWKDRDRVVAEAVAELDDAVLANASQLLDAIAGRTLASLADRAAADTARNDDAGNADRAPLGAVEQGRMRFASGVAHLELRGARIKDLYRATFNGKRPQIAVEPDGLVTVQYKGFSWFGMAGVSAEIALTNAVPWSIEIRRGVSHLAADLRELDIATIDISGGASECELTLPRPRGQAATLRITGGASKLVVKRPRGTAAQISIRGGASSFVFDEQKIGAVGGTVRLSTPSWDTAPDRWAIEVTGGASSLSVTEQ